MSVQPTGLSYQQRCKEEDTVDYTVYKISQAPVVDGKLDEAVWEMFPGLPGLLISSPVTQLILIQGRLYYWMINIFMWGTGLKNPI
ncbi:MAG: hypothetical protein JST63_12705 [Bacteroidetes bacterium]|nr:hypothetical protein [Bacteroidota bacterium]